MKNYKKYTQMPKSKLGNILDPGAGGKTKIGSETKENLIRLLFLTKKYM